MEKKNIFKINEKDFQYTLYRMIMEIIDVLENHAKYISKVINIVEDLSLNQKDFAEVSSILNLEIKKIENKLNSINSINWMMQFSKLKN